MHTRLTLLLLLPIFSFATSLEDAFMAKYESYIYSSLFFIVLLIGFLLYWVLLYKKERKSFKSLVNIKDEAFKTMENRVHGSELTWVKKENELGREIFELKQNIQTLENKLKEGLKSQVVLKIDEYQAKRKKLMDRADIKV